MSILQRKLLHVLSSSTGSLRLINQAPVSSHLVRHATEGQEEVISVDSMCRKWAQQFRERGIPDPESSADLIIAHSLGKKMIHEVSSNVVINKNLGEKINKLCTLRLDRKPVQYIIEEWDFLDITLKMRPPVLIPRPETEELCGRIVTELNETGRATQPVRLLDIGCGTGAIALYLLTKLQKATCVALDKCSDACKLTSENATRLELAGRLQILHGDITQDEVFLQLHEKRDFDVIVSNPPYIPSDDMKTLMPEVQRYESHDALDGGKDGLDIIGRVLKVAGQLLKTNGSLWLETDVDHPSKIKGFVEGQPSLNLQFIDMFTDFSRRERFCKLRRVAKT